MTSHNLLIKLLGFLDTQPSNIQRVSIFSNLYLFICVYYPLLSCALMRILNVLLNSSHEGRYPFLISILGRFFTINDMIFVRVLIHTFIGLRNFPLHLVFWIFLSADVQFYWWLFFISMIITYTHTNMINQNYSGDTVTLYWLVNSQLTLHFEDKVHCSPCGKHFI